MRTIFLCVSLALFCGGRPDLFAELPNHPSFAQEQSDLTADPQVRFGKLSNGLGYAIMANHEPKQRASFRLLVLAGSAEESDAQQGLAHFVEHLAFKGTTHYPPGTIIKYFQRLGMGFGNDTNAHTEFARTVYLLELPNTENHTLTEACQVLCDDARGELILGPEIESERGVILSEKRDRDSQDFRRYVALENFLHSDLLLSKRIPIGKTEVIEHAPPSEFRSYYDQWYRPERMAIVAVGDFDPNTVEAEIKSAAAKLQASGPATPDPTLGTIANFKGERVLYFPQPEAAETLVIDQRIRPYAKEIDNRANRLKHLPRWLALSMLDRRLEILSRQADAPFLAGGFQIEHDFDLFQTSGFMLACKPEHWSEALELGEKELRRALAFGFTSAELDEAVANYRHGLEEAVKTESTRRSPELADAMLECLTDDIVFTTPEENLALEKPVLDRITAADCLAALREDFPDAGRYIAVLGNAKISATEEKSSTSARSPEDQIREIYLAAQKTPIEPPAQNAATHFAYTDFGPAAKITEQRHVDDLDVDLLTLGNGVRLNLKKTDFEANRIEIAMRVGSGVLSEPRDKPGLAAFTRGTFIEGGLGKHSVDEIIRLAAGHTVGLDFRIDSDAFRLGGTTNRNDLLLQLQLLAAYLTDPAYRPEAMSVARKNFEAMYSKLEHTPEGLLRLKVDRELASGDPRFGTPPREDLFARNLDEERQWLQPQLGKGAIEITLVGDLDRDAVIAAVAQTIGALPARDSRPELADARRVAFPAAFAQTLEVETEIPRALVTVIWPTTDSRDVHRQRRLTLLARVFGDRLRIELRDKMGSAYSPTAYDLAGETFPGYGRMQTRIEADPKQTQPIQEAVLRLAAELAKGGITADELTRAKEPVLTLFRESSRTNGYWLGSVLESAQENPQHLDWCRNRYADTEAITAAELDALAKEYLSPDKAFRIVISPRK